jgi:hypothetical protein
MSIPIINQNTQLIKKYIPISRAFGDTALTFYVASIYLGGIYGMYKGSINWYNWIYKRKEHKIKYKLFEPIVNIAIDTSRLGWEILMPAFASAGVIATFPISIPLLPIFSTETTESDKTI